MNAGMLRMLHEHGLSDGAALGARPRHRRGVAVDMRATVAQAVIPRLRQAMATRLDAVPAPVLARGCDGALPDVEWLASHLLRGDHDRIEARIEAARRDGTTLQHIYLRWLVPAAVHLADQAAGDVLGLAEATLAFANLRLLLRRHEADFCHDGGEPASGLRALVAAPAAATGDPELAVFGLLLTAQFFRRDGWDARAERDCRSTAFTDAVANEWFDLVEMLATSDRDLDAISTSIRLVRKGSPNRAVGVVVCGSIFQDRPEFVRMVGADRSATDPLTSLSQANHLIALGSNRRFLS